MATPLWVVELIKKSFAGLFLAARATNLPVIGDLAERMLFDGDDLMYLPADRVVRIDQEIEPQRSMVLPSQVVEHFIEGANYRWIMNSCICRDANGCQSYPRNLGCLFLGEAALGINPELGRPATRREALDHVGHCRDAGLVHLVGRNKLDAVWLNVGPGNKLLTICNCCPCCCLWRMIPYASSSIASKVTRMPGVSVAVTDRCTGCGACAGDICFVGAITLRDGNAEIGDACRGCGRCIAACPQEAITLSLDSSRWFPDSVARIGRLVDLS